MAVPSPHRVTVGNECASGNNLEFFVATGSMENPIVCAADNNGFPFVRDLYARPMHHEGQQGIHVSVRFEAAAHGNGFAVNVWQSAMTGPFTTAHV
jgi:hypothetical protein